MALIRCPECGKEISDRAVLCPQCGLARRGSFYCFEYRSKAALFGLPLVHIVLGPALDPSTARLRVAKGIIAIGGIAVGFLSFGGVSFGLISLGGVAIGLAAIGGCAIGAALAIGGLAIGYVAVGGAALGYYVLGPGRWGVENLGRQSQNTQILGLLKRYVTLAAIHCLKYLGISL